MSIVRRSIPVFLGHFRPFLTKKYRKWSKWPKNTGIDLRTIDIIAQHKNLVHWCMMCPYLTEIYAQVPFLTDFVEFWAKFDLSRVKMALE